jgi:hypothetical protein
VAEGWIGVSWIDVFSEINMLLESAAADAAAVENEPPGLAVTPHGGGEVIGGKYLSIEAGKAPQVSGNFGGAELDFQEWEWERGRATALVKRLVLWKIGTKMDATAVPRSKAKKRTAKTEAPTKPMKGPVIARTRSIGETSLTRRTIR